MIYLRILKLRSLKSWLNSNFSSLTLLSELSGYVIVKFEVTEIEFFRRPIWSFCTFIPAILILSSQIFIRYHPCSIYWRINVRRWSTAWPGCDVLVMTIVVYELFTHIWFLSFWFSQRCFLVDDFGKEDLR